MRIYRGQLLLAMAALTWLGGCASIGPPLPPSLELPHPPSDLKAVRKGNKVTLTWTIPPLTTDHQSVRYLGKTQICRSINFPLAACGVPVAYVAPPADLAAQATSRQRKVQATFSQVLPDELQRNEADVATYAVEVLNRADRASGLSNQVHVPLARALPAPAELSAKVTDQGVVLEWAAASSPVTGSDTVQRSYRVYRRSEGSQRQTLIGEKGELDTPSIVDQSFEWEKMYFYHADTLTVIPQTGKMDMSIEGDDTPEIKVFVHDTFPPGVPSGVEAVFSGARQQSFIDLIWAPVTDADLAGYNVYRREAGSAALKMNTELVRIPAFRDPQVTAGQKYLYSISAVDVRGNESSRSEEAEELVP